MNVSTKISNISYFDLALNIKPCDTNDSQSILRFKKGLIRDNYIYSCNKKLAL